jgi:hypothetical protein
VKILFSEDDPTTREFVEKRLCRISTLDPTARS